MHWYGKEIYCNRGETFSLDCSILNNDDSPYRVSTLLANAFLLLTVASKTSQNDRYIFRNWINLSNFPKVKNVEIVDVESLPTGDDLIRHRVLRSDGKYYIYDEVNLMYVEYDFRFVHTFTSDVTKNWVSKTYEYDLKLVSGVLKDDYIIAFENNDTYDGVPFKEITFETQVIDKNNIYVGENLSQGVDYYG